MAGRTVVVAAIMGKRPGAQRAEDVVGLVEIWLGVLDGAPEFGEDGAGAVAGRCDDGLNRIAAEVAAPGDADFADVPSERAAKYGAGLVDRGRIPRIRARHHRQQERHVPDSS